MQQKKATEPLLASIRQVMERQLSEPLPVALYLVATPIGNLADISLRALGVLARADIVYCEDKRHSAKLLNHYGIAAKLYAYHEHNAARERAHLLDFVANGQSVALISDAGTPLVSDPGYKLVVEARELHLSVIAIPGASAPLCALVSAGLPTDQFMFAGFLPAKKQARQKRLARLAGLEATLIFFESPKRLKAALADLGACFEQRPMAIARELTKLHEDVRTGTALELANYYETKETIRGEVVIIVAPASDSDKALSDEELAAQIGKELQQNSLRDAVKAVCARFDLPRSKVYDLAVKIKEGRVEKP